MKLLKLIAFTLISINTLAHFDIACWFNDNNYRPDIYVRIDGHSTQIAIDSVRISEDDGDPLFLGMKQIDGRTYQINKDEVPRILDLDFLQIRSFADLDPHTLMNKFSMNIRFENEWTRFKVKGHTEDNLVCKIIDINSSEVFNYDYVNQFRDLRKSIFSSFFN